MFKLPVMRMNIQLKSIVVAIFASCVCCCSEKRVLADFSNLEEFEGEWKGQWNWDSTQTTQIEIKGNKIKFTNLPYPVPKKDRAPLAGEGQINYNSSWELPNACIIVEDSPVDMMFPIYISKDKKSLYYPLSATSKRSITFKKQ